MKLSTAFNNLQIISALVWAFVMIACSYVLNGVTDSQIVVDILIAGASTHFLLLNNYKVEKKTMGGNEIL